MKTLLRIDASARTDNSYSRGLADYVEQAWKQQNTEHQVIYRDLAKTLIPHVQQTTIEGFYTPPQHLTAAQKDALVISDELIQELLSADEILISSPLYNLNVPSGLKAYLDQVVRIGYTFKTTHDGVHQGLLQNKSAYLVLVKGGSYRGTLYEAFDFQEPYLKAILQYIGVKPQAVFSLEGTSDEETLQKNLPNLYQQIDTIFQTQPQVL
ncbi:MAG TPA: FMN-dependent NADH-azoreductase [Microscillaceae bacterium]|nr:FMN-dependent NADH-azoreductase [Microscillaceae bacterium]